MPSKDLNQGTKVVFADGEGRNIKPLTIKQLRKFMKVIVKIDSDKAVLEDVDIDNMVEAAKIVLAKFDIKDEDIEDILDLRSFNEMLAAAMGTDPNA